MEEKHKNEDRVVTRRLLILLIIFVFFIFILAYQIFPVKKFNLFVDSFNKIAVGPSALAAVIFGPSLVSRELEKDRKIKEYWKRFPHENFGKKWEIIASELYPDAIYVLNFNNKVKHHILNMKTVWDLGWHIYPRNQLPDKQFKGYKVGDTIRTRGEANEE